MEQDDEYYMDEYDFYDEDYSPAEVLSARIEYFDFKHEWLNLFENCMSSVLLQSLVSLKTLIVCCLLFRFTVYAVYVAIPQRSGIHHNFLHVFGAFFGFVSLYSINSDSYFETFFLIISFVLFTYFLFYTFSKLSLACAKSISVCTVLFLIFGELLVQNTQLWHQIRGIMLLLAMKAISVGSDLDSKSLCAVPSFISYAAYCMHSGTMLFGPWVTFTDYSLSVLHPKQLSLTWFFSILKSLSFSFACLLLSSCVLSYLFIDGAQPDLPAITPFVGNQWMLSWQSAVAFHFSHFYICFLSQATCMLSGIGKFSESNDLVWSEFVVVKPLSVIFPSSMLKLVVAWNIPMSNWLKKYIFNAYKHLGRTTAILLTYAASAILHGLSFHLASVLLSLSFYTYVEYVLRKKLSFILECGHIQSRPPAIENRTNPLPMWSYIFNFMWILINMAHLAYLGSMFRADNDEIEVEGYHMQHTIEKWRNLGFLSHIFAMLCFVFAHLLPNPTPSHRKAE